MIALKNIYKNYGQQEVLKNFSAEFPDGSKTALMGHSGVGKTTVLKLIMGLEKPDSGEVYRSEGRLAVVFQEDRLVEEMSALGNLKIVLKKGAEADPEEILEALGLAKELLSKPVRELSGGEKRRVAIARALAVEPDVLLLDEPFKGIDEATLPKVIGEISSRAERATVILVTHSEAEAGAMGAEIVKLE